MRHLYSVKKTKRLTLDDLPPKLRQQALSQIERDNHANRLANMEQAVGGERERANSYQEDGQICRVYVHNIRKKLADNDNISGKAMLDRLVEAGILLDDTPKEVEFVRHTQEVTKEEEITIIRIDVYE
jgi:hypothetical protein